jgi:hypothetical protein
MARLKEYLDTESRAVLLFMLVLQLTILAGVICFVAWLATRWK